MNASEYRGVIERAVWSASRRFGVRLQPADVEDLVQETLLVLWQRGASPAQEAISAYLFRAAQNVAVDALRRQGAKKRGAWCTEPLDEIREVPDRRACARTQLIGREDLTVRLARCRSLLSARSFRVLELVLIRGLRSVEAARIMGCSASAIDTAVSRARRALEEHGIQIRRRSR